MPLTLNGEFYGFIQGKFRAEDFLQKIFAEGQSEIHVFIKSDGNVFYSREFGETVDPGKWMISSTIEYKGLNWTFQSVPDKAHFSKLRTMLPEVVMTFGLIFAWTLGAAVRSEQKAKEHEVEHQRYEKALINESTLVRLSKNIAVASNDLPDMDSILEFSLREICEFIKWPVGHIYLVDDSMMGLTPSQVWYLQDSNKYASFRSVTEQLYFKKGEGLPGRVLAEAKSVWIPDLMYSLNFPRNEASQRVGLCAGMAVPIMVGDKVGGVMEFFIGEKLVLDQGLLENLAPLGAQLGRVLERDRSNKKLSQQALVLDQINDAVISLDSQTNITAWNKGAERVFGFEEEWMLGKPLAYLFPDEEKAIAQKLIQPAIINGRYEMEIEAINKSGTFIYIHMGTSKNRVKSGWMN